MSRHAQKLWADVRDGMRGQPGRVGLSLFAVTIGIMALAVLVTVLEGLREKSRELVRELGANVVALVAGGEGEDRAAGGNLLRWAGVLEAGLPGARIAVMRTSEVSVEGADRKVAVVGTDEHLAAVRQWRLVEGRFLDAVDVRSGARHMVVSRAVSEEWDWRPGGVRLIQNTPFRIVGVVESGGSGRAEEHAENRIAVQEKTVFIPHTTRVPWIENQQAMGQVDVLLLQLPAGVEAAEARRRAETLLAAPGMRAEQATWVTPDTLLAGIRRLQRTISFSAGSIAVLCLILGGTTLMSLMLANVRDRVTEIGLRRALGARPQDVAALFVAEACLITGLSSLLGVGAAAALLLAGRSQFPLPITIGWSTVLIPVLASVVLGIMFSFWPARMAARLSPAEALRND